MQGHRGLGSNPLRVSLAIPRNYNMIPGKNFFSLPSESFDHPYRLPKDLSLLKLTRFLIDWFFDNIELDRFSGFYYRTSCSGTEPSPISNRYSRLWAVCRSFILAAATTASVRWMAPVRLSRILRGTNGSVSGRSIQCWSASCRRQSTRRR